MDHKSNDSNIKMLVFIILITLNRYNWPVDRLYSHSIQITHNSNS